jgi:hypothetical protein
LKKNQEQWSPAKQWRNYQENDDNYTFIETVEEEEEVLRLEQEIEND